MPFAYPAALWLLPAVALPIVFHLFFRLRRQVRHFPSLMFFQRIDPRLSSKRKIHEWLILFLRCLFLLLLIFALARPMLGLQGSAEKVARLVLIDNSGSMAGPVKPPTSKLTLAARATQKLIASTQKGDAIDVQLMVPDPTASLPPGFDTATATLNDATGKITPTDAAPNVPRAIRAALATLDTAKAPHRELHILTDLQQKNWSRGELGALLTNARIIVHRLDTPSLVGGSVSLEPLEIPTRAIPAGRVTPVRVTLRNEGPAPGRVRLNGTDDSGKNFSRDVEIPGGGAMPLTLTFSFNTPGFHWAQLWLEGEVASAATRCEIGFWIIDAQKVLFVGAKGDFGALSYAVSPGGNANLSGIDATCVAANDLATALNDKPLAVAMTWENWPRDAATVAVLQDYVRNGGTLILLPVPGAGVTVPVPPAAWIDANPTTLVKPADPEPMLALHDGDSLWRDLRDDGGRAKLGQLRALQYRPLKIGRDWQILLASSKGAALFARRELDRGRIFASGLAFTPAWSSLPFKSSYVALMQNMVFGDIEEHIPVQGLRAGDDVRFEYPDGAVAVKSLAGSALDWHGQVREFDGLPRAGVYEITQRDHVTWATVSGNADEADPHYLPKGQVPLLRDLPHDILPLATEDDIFQSSATVSAGTTLYRWLLLAALLVLLLETWLANERSADLGVKLFKSLLLGKATKLAAPTKPQREVARA